MLAVAHVVHGFNIENVPKTFKGGMVEKIDGLAKVAKIAAVPTAILGSTQLARADPSRKLEYQPALQGLDYGKPRTVYPDFTQKPSGLQYKMVREGTGAAPQPGDRVVVDWEGYTIGYYGRPFQTRNKVKGGAFDNTDADFFRWIVGSGTAVAALDEGIQDMKEGGITQIIVPAELGYPANGDGDHDIVGPKPSSFSGMRALNFVLDNKNLIDKTLLINVRLVRVDKGYSKKTSS